MKNIILKKIMLFFLTAITVICVSLGVVNMLGERRIALADAEVSLSSKTVAKRTTAGDKMLLVTAILNYGDVYEIGYTFKDKNNADVALTTYEARTGRYYSSITSGTKTQTAEDLFGKTYAGAGLIIWEVEWQAGVNFQAYAKKGTRDDNGALTTDNTVTINGTVKCSDNLVKYEVVFYDEDGKTELDRQTVFAGDTPVYNGETPTKAATAQYTYTFNGWSPAISAVSANAEYVAQYAATVNNYTVKFDTDGGSEIAAQSVPYGTAASELSAFTPTKTGYTFVKWQYYNGEAYVDIPNDMTVTGDVTVKAVWEINKYTVTITVNDDNYGSIDVNSVANVTYGTTITTDGNKLNINGTVITATYATADAQYTYAFDRWDNAVTVAGDMTVTAIFTATVKTYTLTVNVNNGDYGAVDVDSVANVPYGSEITVSDNVLTVNGTDVTADPLPATTAYTYAVSWTYDDIVTGDQTVTATFVRLSNTDMNFEEGIVYGHELTNATSSIYEYDETIPAPYAGNTKGIKMTLSGNGLNDGLGTFKLPAALMTAGDYWQAWIYVESEATILDYSVNTAFNLESYKNTLDAGWNKVLFLVHATSAIGHIRISEKINWYIDDVKKLSASDADYTFENQSAYGLVYPSIDGGAGVGRIYSDAYAVKYSDLDSAVTSGLPFNGGDYCLKYVYGANNDLRVYLPSTEVKAGDVYTMWIYVSSPSTTMSIQSVDQGTVSANFGDGGDGVMCNKWELVTIKIPDTAKNYGLRLYNPTKTAGCIYIDSITKCGNIFDGDLTVDYEDGIYGARISNGYTRANSSLYSYSTGTIAANPNGGNQCLKLVKVNETGYFRISKNLMYTGDEWTVDIYIPGGGTIGAAGCTLSQTSIPADTWTTVTITVTGATGNLAGFYCTAGTVYVDNLKLTNHAQ